MPEKEDLITHVEIETRIFEIRGQKIILDSDLAKIYGVSTKYLIRLSYGTRSASRKISRFLLPRRKLELSGHNL